MKKLLIALLATLTLLAAVPQVSFADDELPTPPPVEDGEEEKGDNNQTSPPDGNMKPVIKPTCINGPLEEA